jgi:tetratricopeptide (TPR) repeat protein
VGVGTVALFVMIILILSVFKIYENEIGIKHSRDFIQNSFFEDSFETEHFVIYFPLGTKVSENIELIALDHEWRYAQLTDFLNVNPKKKIVSYIYPDEKTRKKLIGAGDTTIANPIHMEIHLVYDYFPHPVLKHELTHVLSSEFGTRFLKISPKVGLLVGLAVAADWDNSDGFNPDEWSLGMLRANNNLDIHNILGFGFWKASASKSYTLMGSFVRFLINKYGIEKFKTVYREGKFEVYGKDLNTIIKEWEDYLLTIEIAEFVPALSKHKFGKPSIFDDHCPRRSSYLSDIGLSEFERGNYYGAVTAFKQALKYNPTSNNILESLAYSYYFNTDYNRLTGLYDDRTKVSEITENIVLNLIGTYHWTRGNAQKGKTIFNELKNKPLPIDIENEITIKIDSIQKGAVEQDGIKQYYLTKDILKRVSILESLTKKFPEYAVPYYLLGRLFFNKWEFDIAKNYLIRSQQLGLPSEKLKLDNSRLLGISLYASGQYDRAKETFGKIYGKRKRGRFGSVAEQFIKRSEWTKIYSLNL